MRQLQRQLTDVKKEKEVEIQQRNEMIAHLKDQLQEMKAKTNMEGKYIKKCAEVAVAQTQKRCNMSEKDMKDEIEVKEYCAEGYEGNGDMLCLVQWFSTFFFTEGIFIDSYIILLRTSIPLSRTMREHRKQL